MDSKVLKKALHKTILKAYHGGKRHAVDHIVADIEDPNNIAQVPKDHVPAPSESVLNKEDKALSELHGQKQLNAQAKLGQAPKMSQASAAPKPTSSAMPKMGVPSMPKMPSANGIGKLKKFMDGVKAKRLK